MNTKHVLLVVRWPVGGIRTFIRYVYRGFANKQWRFTIIAPNLSEVQVLAQDLSALDVELVLVDADPSFASLMVAVFRALTRRRYAIVHSHGFTSGISAAVFTRMFRVPHVLTSHDILMENQFAGTKGLLKKKILKYTISLTDVVHSVSNDAQENLLSFFPPAPACREKYVVYPNGIETSRFTEIQPRNLREELNLDNDVFLVGFFGRFMAQKGFRFLVEAIELLWSMENLLKKILVVTFGDGGFIREEEAALAKRNLTEAFCFMPFTPNIASAIQGVDVVVMPSLWEACPLVPMETMLCGTPIIGTDCLGLREVLQNTPARVVPTGDGPALAEAIRDEMETSSKDAFWAFRETAQKRFSVQQTQQNIEQLYIRLSELGLRKSY